MTTTLTTNYGIPKPSTGTVGTADGYGTLMDAADAAIHAAVNAAADAHLGNEIWVGTVLYPTLDAVLANAAITEGTVVVPNDNHYLSPSVDRTLKPGLTLRLLHGAIIHIETGRILTINGTIDAGLYQIFSSTGTGKVVFGAGAVTQVHPAWWGTDYAALQAAATAAENATLAITADYTITSALTIPANTTVEATVPLPEISTSSNIIVGSGVKLKGLALTFTGAATSGVYGDSLTSLEIRDCVIVGTVAQQMMVRIESSSNARIINNDLSGGGDLIYLYKTGNTVIEGNYLHDNTDAGTFDNGIHLVTDEATAMSNIRIVGNTLKDMVVHGITMWSGDCAAYDYADQDGKRQLSNVTITGNTLDTCGGAGIWGSLLEGITVTGNTIRNTGTEGIDFEGSRNCVADGNTLYNAGPNYGALTVFFSSRDIVFSNNTVLMENDEVTLGAGKNAKATSLFAMIRDDCSRIKFIGNNFRSKTVGSYCGEINIWKGSITAAETAAGTNHHTRAVQDLVIENNTFMNGDIYSVQYASYITVKGNTFVDDVDITNVVYLICSSFCTVSNNIIRSTLVGAELNSGNLVVGQYYIITATEADHFYAGCAIGHTFLATATTGIDASNKVKLVGSALSGVSKSPIRISNASQTIQYVINAVAEGNQIIGYPATGITLDTYINHNSDYGSVCARNNKAAYIYVPLWASYKITELNHNPITYALITATTF